MDLIITPEPGKEAEIGQRLLALADHPRQVQWVTWPVAGFSVPLELFAKFEQHGNHVEVSLDEEALEAATEGAEAVTVELAEEEEPATPKKRGRQRKTAVDSTDEEKEE